MLLSQAANTNTRGVLSHLYSHAVHLSTDCYMLNQVFANSGIVLSLYYLVLTAHQFCSRASSRSQGSHSHQGGVTSALGINDRGVTHAGESFTPLTPAIIMASFFSVTLSLSDSFSSTLGQRSVSYLLLDWTHAQGNQDHLCWQLTVAQSGHTESAHSLFISPPTHTSGISSLLMCHAPY